MIFDNVSFNAKDFLGSQAEGKTLYIYTTNKTFDIDYSSAPKALEAMTRLETAVQSERVVPESESTSVFAGLESLFSKGFSTVKDKAQEVVSGTSVKNLLFQMAADKAGTAFQDKAEKMVKDLEGILGTVTAHTASTKQSFEERMNTMFEKINEQFNDEDADVPDEAVKPKGKKFNMFQGDVFNGVSADDLEIPTPAPGTVGAPDEPLIGDLTNAELLGLIDEFVDGALNNPKTQIIFGNIYDIFGKEEADEAVDNLKRLIYEMSLECPELKLSQVLQRFLG